MDGLTPILTQTVHRLLVGSFVLLRVLSKPNLSYHALGCCERGDLFIDLTSRDVTLHRADWELTPNIQRISPHLFESHVLLVITH